LFPVPPSKSDFSFKVTSEKDKAWSNYPCRTSSFSIKLDFKELFNFEGSQDFSKLEVPP